MAFAANSVLGNRHAFSLQDAGEHGLDSLLVLIDVCGQQSAMPQQHRNLQSWHPFSEVNMLDILQ